MVGESVKVGDTGDTGETGDTGDTAPVLGEVDIVDTAIK